MAEKEKQKAKQVKEPITSKRLQQIIEEAVGPDMGEMYNSAAIAAITYRACMVAAQAVMEEVHGVRHVPELVAEKRKQDIKDMGEAMFSAIYPRTASLYLANPLGGSGIERPSGQVILHGGPDGRPPRI